MFFGVFWCFFGVFFGGYWSFIGFFWEGFWGVWGLGFGVRGLGFMCLDAHSPHTPNTHTAHHNTPQRKAWPALACLSRTGLSRTGPEQVIAWRTSNVARCRGTTTWDSRRVRGWATAKQGGEIRRHGEGRSECAGLWISIVAREKLRDSEWN